MLDLLVLLNEDAIESPISQELESSQIDFGGRGERRQSDKLVESFMSCGGESLKRILLELLLSHHSQKVNILGVVSCTDLLEGLDISWSSARELLDTEPLVIPTCRNDDSCEELVIIDSRKLILIEHQVSVESKRCSIIFFPDECIVY